jgi:hypothetical protein
LTSSLSLDRDWDTIIFEVTLDPPSSAALKEIKDTGNSFRTLEFLINDQQYICAVSALLDAAAWTSLCKYETIQLPIKMFYSLEASMFE